MEGMLGEVVVVAVGSHPRDHSSGLQVPPYMKPAATRVNTVIAAGSPRVDVENWQILAVDALERVLDDALGRNEFEGPLEHLHIVPLGMGSDPDDRRNTERDETFDSSET